VHRTATEAPEADPVGRFHLNNGARLQRINAAGDLSRKGLKQSFGMMVNYLYDLDEIEANHEKFMHGEVAAARAVLSLM
jgi:malonyl-CoA decarboxylase